VRAWLALGQRLAAVRLAVVFLAVPDVPLFLAVVVVFLAAADVVLLFLAVVAEVAVLAVLLRAAVFAVPVAAFAVDFLAGGDDVDFVEVAAFEVAFLAAVFAVPDVVADFAVVRFAGPDEDAVFAESARAADRFVVPVVRAEVLIATLGSFLAPDTTALRSAPARNFGTAVFLARVRSPVRGLRTIRAGRTAFSKAPNPVMATFSPLTTSRVIVSRTDSRACRADALLPSKWLESASIS